MAVGKIKYCPLSSLKADNYIFQTVYNQNNGLVSLQVGQLLTNYSEITLDSSKNYSITLTQVTTDNLIG